MVHMVQQIIKYSDGTETVINYRGEIVDGVLIPDNEVNMSEDIIDGGASSDVEEAAVAPASAEDSSAAEVPASPEEAPLDAAPAEEAVA